MIHLVDVNESGAVRLGPDVCCDGFISSSSVRVQTHLHSDHLGGFSTSKGVQKILMSEPTYRILCMEENADIPYRSNIITGKETPLKTNSSSVSIYPSGHTLGGVQVLVECESGARLAYSSDFSWPLSEVVKADVLVLDSTYGSTQSVRNYSQGECEEKFVNLVKKLISKGPVHLISHRGTLQRALQLLSGEIDVPFIGSSGVRDRVNIYREYGYVIKDIIEASNVSDDIEESSRYIRVYGTGDKKPVDDIEGATVKLSAYFTRPDDPVAQYSSRSFGVALSDHADFFGTVEYVTATGADYVLTDNSRGGNAIELAEELNKRISVKAKPSISHSASGKPWSNS